MQEQREVTIALLTILSATAIVSIIAYALGWFVYGSPNGGLAIILLCVIYGCCSVLAAIPLIGFIIDGYVLLNIAWPAVSQFGMIEASWLTTIIFVLYILYGFFITANTTMMAMER